jgi:hypothetical protein
LTGSPPPSIVEIEFKAGGPDIGAREAGTVQKMKKMEIVIRETRMKAGMTAGIPISADPSRRAPWGS